MQEYNSKRRFVRAAQHSPVAVVLLGSARSVRVPTLHSSAPSSTPAIQECGDVDLTLGCSGMAVQRWHRHGGVARGRAAPVAPVTLWSLVPCGVGADTTPAGAAGRARTAASPVPHRGWGLHCLYARLSPARAFTSLVWAVEGRTGGREEGQRLG